MKNRQTIRSQLLTIFISAILVVSVIIGSISIYEVDQYVQESTKEMLTSTCEKEATVINNLLNDMTIAVDIMKDYVIKKVEKGEALQDEQFLKTLTTTTEYFFLDLANLLRGIENFYLRFAPELTNSKAGFYFGIDKETGEYKRLQNTDLSLYEPDDIQNVGWYWEPVKKGGPLWMMPYYSKKYNSNVISYVVPIYKQDELLGVVGMDLNYAFLTDKIDQMKVYTHDEAFLAKDNILVYHSNLKAGQPVPEPEGIYMWTFAQLDNGMDFCLLANYEDMWKVRYNIAIKIIGIVGFMVIVFTVIVIHIIRKLTSPIKKLTEAAVKLSEGDYDVDTEYSGTKEMAQLSDAFAVMTVKLREHDQQQHRLAYWDSLTGLRNATAYKNWVLEYSKDLPEKDGQFAITVLDLNYLKNVNDMFGHTNGNQLIVAAAKIIASTFKHSPVFRIGGDEFVAVLQNNDFEQREELLKLLDERAQSTCIEIGEMKVPVCIARGVAVYSKETDTSIDDVFNRADDDMYKHKRVMKAQGKVPF